VLYQLSYWIKISKNNRTAGPSRKAGCSTSWATESSPRFSRGKVRRKLV